MYMISCTSVDIHVYICILMKAFLSIVTFCTDTSDEYTNSFIFL